MYTPEAWENHQLYITAYEWNPQVDALYFQAEAQIANLNYQLVLHKFKMIEKGKTNLAIITSSCNKVSILRVTHGVHIMVVTLLF